MAGRETVQKTSTTAKKLMATNAVNTTAVGKPSDAKGSAVRCSVPI
jgi:hypothetical protein